MRITTLAITSALVVGVGWPAAAAMKAGSWTPTYSTCEALAMNRGITITERRGSETGPSAYRQFMVACLAGKVEGTPVVAPRIAAGAQIPGTWAFCEDLAMRRGIEVSERRSTDYRTFAVAAVMAACLAGKIH